MILPIPIAAAAAADLLVSLLRVEHRDEARVGREAVLRQQFNRPVGCDNNIKHAVWFMTRIVEYMTKDCPSCAKVVITVAPGIGYSAATGSGTQAEPAQLVSQNFGSASTSSTTT